jgi:hypothetical protein
MKYFRWLALALVASVGWAQPIRVPHAIPRDNNNTPTAIPYGWDGTEYKQLGLGGAIFDSLWVDTLDALDASEDTVVVNRGASANAAAGVVVRNYSSGVIQVRLSADVAAEGTAPLFIAAGGTMFIPVRVDTLFIATADSLPDVQVEVGAVY